MLRLIVTTLLCLFAIANSNAREGAGNHRGSDDHIGCFLAFGRRSLCPTLLSGESVVVVVVGSSVDGWSLAPVDDAVAPMPGNLAAPLTLVGRRSSSWGLSGCGWSVVPNQSSRVSRSPHSFPHHTAHLFPCVIYGSAAFSLCASVFAPCVRNARTVHRGRSLLHRLILGAAVRVGPHVWRRVVLRWVHWRHHGLADIQGGLRSGRRIGAHRGDTNSLSARRPVIRDDLPSDSGGGYVGHTALPISIRFMGSECRAGRHCEAHCHRAWQGELSHL